MPVNMTSVSQTDRPDWHPEDIKAEIRKRGGTVAQLARDSGLSKQLLGQCIERRASEHGDEVIAKFLGFQPHQIWPSRYTAKGTRIRFRATPAAAQVAA
jgi:Ner family transcriptional regulator